MMAQRDIDARSRAQAMTDETAARIIRSSGAIVVTPNGLISRAQQCVQISIGWAVVSIPVRDGRVSYTRERDGKHFTRANRIEGAPERLYWLGPETMTAAHFEAYVQACGIPTLDDLSATHSTPRGFPLAEQAERAARKRGVQYGYGHDMQRGWFSDLYKKQAGLCALSGLPMMRRNGDRCDCLPVPDRINSKRGYYPDNVRLIRHGLNTMRMNRDDETFHRLCASMFLLRAA